MAEERSDFVADVADLDDLLDRGEKHVRLVLLVLQRPELQPYYFLVGGGPEDAIVPCEWRNDREKDAIVAFVTETARGLGAIASLLVGEAWMAHEAGITAEQIARLDPPSQRPNRVEVVWMVAQDAERTVVRFLEIKRDQKGRVSDLQQRKPEPLGWTLSGRMLNVLPARRRHA